MLETYLSIGATMRVGLLSAWASRRGGGVFEALRQHAFELSRGSRLEVRVFALADDRADEDRADLGDLDLTTRPQRGLRAFGFAPGLLDDLLAADLDCLHLHGIWMYPSWVGAAWAARTGRAYIISPHGMLEPWIISRGRWKKAIARTVYEKRSWRSAALFHALTEAEATDIEAALAPLGAASNIVIIPNGIVVPPVSDVARSEPPSILYLGRIHPKKNLEALIEAWTLRPRTGRLTIAGWGEAAHVAALEDHLRTRDDPSISFVGPAYGAAKQALLARARFLVLPSLSEGLPMSVLEAWAAGTPAIMTAACNLPDGFIHGAALETGASPADLAAALDAALALTPAAWTRMSQAASPLVQKHFAAEAIAAQWTAVYAGLVADASRAPRPHEAVA